ncbi:MAG: glycosyltransferase [Endomicrobiaceae bacterium]|nr:glycosyltransferase [Endomicrobiaceae bacterium]MDD3053656.1 glycosyltransferase [Endomicrobiaceae bacterium]MDD3923244.1 glycosyltransferase [Endomicrobiaceae bacterium]MDD5101902.1 glycosyltransferase [Endomicrobiaceae bacterium]
MDTLAIVCTYNEATNIEKVINDILNCDLKDIEVLVADDVSPDGTYKIVEDMSKKDSRVHLLLRKTNKGRGYAGIDAFKWALEHNAKHIVELDGDGSHNPKYIKYFRETIKSCDVVIGSRYVNGGSDTQRGMLRQTVSLLSRKYLNIILGIDVCDPTSGYRMFKQEVVKSFVNKLTAADPFIVTEMLYFAKQSKAVIKEYPIDFLERVSGQSKLRPLTLVKYLGKVLKLRIR